MYKVSMCYTLAIQLKHFLLPESCSCPWYGLFLYQLPLYLFWLVRCCVLLSFTHSNIYRDVWTEMGIVKHVTITNSILWIAMEARAFFCCVACMIEGCQNVKLERQYIYKQSVLGLRYRLMRNATMFMPNLISHSFRFRVVLEMAA